MANYSRMHIGFFLAMERRIVFLSRLGPILRRIIGKREEHDIEYTASDFLELLRILTTSGGNTVRAYFVSYKYLPAGTPENALIKANAADRDRENLLTVIYRAVTRDATGVEIPKSDYILVHDAQGLKTLLNPIVSSTWIDHWENHKRPQLEQIMKQEGLDIGKDGQTKSISYEMPKFVEFYNELLGWGTNFKGVTLHFSGYKKREKVNGDSVANQITIVFECKDDFPFLLTTTEEFREALQEYFNDEFLGSNNDTGLPCPPNTNCPN